MKRFRNKHPLTRMDILSLVAVAGFLLSFVANILPINQASAVGPVYTWADMDTVRVSGLPVVSSTDIPMKVTGNVITKNQEVKGQGRITVNTSDGQCWIEIILTMTDTTHLKEIVDRSTGASQTGSIPECASKYLDQYDNQTVATTNDRNDSGNQTQPESPSSQVVTLTVHDYNKAPPANGNLVVTNSSGKKYAVSPVRFGNATDGYSYMGTVRITSPGKYTFSAPNLSNTVHKTFTKVKYQSMSVQLTIGTPPENADDRRIHVRVIVKNPVVNDLTAEQTVGQFPVELRQGKNTQALQQQTATVTYQPSTDCTQSGSCAAPSELGTGIYFTDVSPASNYHICIAKINKCVDAGKAAGEVPEYTITLTQDEANSANIAEKDKSTCVVDGIGWILCPVMTTVGKITDQSYQVVQAFMTVKPLSTNTSDPLYKAWAMIRNFANVAFVLVFLIIIFSQLTSLGVSNYGIKKLLPRIVIAAILVNVSYWICAIAVDLSNILGASLGALFNGPTQDVMNNVKGGDASVLNGSNSWTNIAGGLLGGTLLAGGLLYAGLSVLLPILVAALCAIIAIVVVLVARQALIILLIVLAPLAFVAYLLPNTERLFKRWLGLFQTLLLLYPIIAIGYGVCKFAGALLMGVG